MFISSFTDLVLLLLEGALGLLEGGLQLELLVLQALPDLVDLVDVAAALADLYIGAPIQ